ncbi:hypothetical protein F5884DRAFT_314137 [Xylogone sp. PMI_703]|nr:hypothetical protein F5884DRAFT_314137 [Xylogone sp. PMI_703]
MLNNYHTYYGTTSISNTSTLLAGLSKLALPPIISFHLSTIMSYDVYRVKYNIAIADPDMPSPRYHNVIFVKTEDNGDGFVHEVAGDITSGMYYDTRSSKWPDNSDDCHSKELLGTIKASDYPDELDQVLRALPPPPKQKHFNPQTMRTEQIKPDGTFYEPGESGPPMIKCTEWIANQAVPALYASGILQK